MRPLRLLKLRENFLRISSSLAMSALEVLTRSTTLAKNGRKLKSQEVEIKGPGQLRARPGRLSKVQNRVGVKNTSGKLDVSKFGLEAHVKVTPGTLESLTGRQN
jgi:hypothetical protein